jgi:hypothetical protein
MRYEIPLKGFAAALAFALIAAIMAPVPLTAGGQKIKFTTFTVPGSAGATTLGVDGVNDKGAIVGYYVNSSGAAFGFLRTPSGTFAPVADPANSAPPPATEAIGINNSGTITGLTLITASNHYEGFVDTKGTFTTYVIPGLPALSEAIPDSINDVGGLCGWVIQNKAPNDVPPYIYQGFVSLRNGATTALFSVANSTETICYEINNSNTAAGWYPDRLGPDYFADRCSGCIDDPGQRAMRRHERGHCA